MVALTDSQYSEFTGLIRNEGGSVLAGNTFIARGGWVIAGNTTNA